MFGGLYYGGRCTSELLDLGFALFLFVRYLLEVFDNLVEVLCAFFKAFSILFPFLFGFGCYLQELFGCVKPLCFDCLHLLLILDALFESDYLFYFSNKVPFP